MAPPPPSSSDAAADAPAWRLLLVDDSDDDAELAEITLRDAGLRVACRRVDTAAGLRAALAEFAPQLVLSDLNLPGFSGTEALAIVRAEAPSLPFVFFTGSLIPPPPADGLVDKDAMHTLPEVVRRLLGA